MPDRIAFIWNGTGHSNLNFGDVDLNTFATGGARTGMAGNTVSFGLLLSVSGPAIRVCTGVLQPNWALLFLPAVAVATIVG